MVRMKDQEFILWCNLGRKLRTSSGFFGGDDPETFPVGWVEIALRTSLVCFDAQLLIPLIKQAVSVESMVKAIIDCDVKKSKD